MADATYTPLVYMMQGGGELVVASSGLLTIESGGAMDVESGGAIDVQSGGTIDIESGGTLDIEAGGSITAAGTQASHIADLATGATNAQIATAFNTLLVAIEGVGITATS